MRRLIVLGVVAAAVCVSASSAHALLVNDTVDVSIGVSEIFSLTIGDATIDMGTVVEGAGGVGSTTLFCGTNRSLPWTLQVKATDITGVTTLNVIPMELNAGLAANTYEFYTVLNAAAGTVVPATLMALTDTLAYTSGIGEDSDTDVRVDLGLVIRIPYNTPSDTYGSTVTVTMTE